VACRSPEFQVKEKQQRMLFSCTFNREKKQREAEIAQYQPVVQAGVLNNGGNPLGEKS